MSKRSIRDGNFFERLGREYRMVFLDDESMEEVTSYKLSMGKLYILGSSLFVAIVLITVSIMLLTPLKYYIPGYGNDKARMQTIKLKQTVDSLTDLVSAQQQYEANIKSIIAGEEPKRDTEMLDMRKVKQEDMSSIVPQTKQIKQNAIEVIKQENKKQKK
ncbi:MAG: hypothetical protein EOP51_30995 [Sphingobacteriales bacterium]|nr:MAG: hypothetical protein EOP51_30995 [Sphingobacteriales bacterium]